MTRQSGDSAVESRVAYQLMVTQGVHAEAKYQLPVGSTVASGTDLQNDIVIRDGSVDEWEMLIDTRPEGVFLTVVQGDVRTQDAVLERHVQILADEGNEYFAGNTSFRVLREFERSQKTGPVPGDDFLRAASNRSEFARNAAVIGGSVALIALPIIAITFAVSGSVIMVSANSEVVTSTFEKELQTLELANIEYTPQPENSSYLVTGSVDTRNQRNTLLEMARNTNSVVELDIQVNDEFSETIADIYRVHGISASVEVLGRGHVVVHTKTDDLEQLRVIQKAIKIDVPSLQKLESVNEVPGKVFVESKKPARVDPEKRITLIVAGNSAYIMTQDNSRYFIGALLPSGHLVESIENGVVVVSKNGKQDTLTY